MGVGAAAGAIGPGADLLDGLPDRPAGNREPDDRHRRNRRVGGRLGRRADAPVPAAGRAPRTGSGNGAPDPLDGWRDGKSDRRNGEGARVEGARVEGVRVQPIDQDFDPGDAPLFWLGDADDPQSIDWLIDRYDGAGSTDAREDLMAAIGAHRAPEHALPFLRRVLTGDAAKDLRTGAAFWIGQQNTPEVLPLLRRTAESDDDAEVRERAVFGIRQVEGPEATDVLAGLARTAESQNIREKAVFWLGQRASDRAAEVLGDVARSTGDTDIQEQAVFAISRLPADQSVPRLIEIARMHPTLQIRKKAIFWLGQSDDDRAVDALLEIARGGG